MWFHPLSSFSSQPFLCCCNLVYATWILIYPRNLDLNLSMQLGFRFIHASWIWIYPRNFDLDFSTRLRPRFLHASWTWICPRDFNLDSSTRLGFVDATWSCNIHATQTQIYRRDLDLSMQLRLGFIHATWTQIFFLTQIGLGFGRFCSHPLLLDLDYFCLVHPIDPYVVTNRLTTSKSTS